MSRLMIENFRARIVTTMFLKARTINLLLKSGYWLWKLKRYCLALRLGPTTFWALDGASWLIRWLNTPHPKKKWRDQKVTPLSKYHGRRKTDEGIILNYSRPSTWIWDGYYGEMRRVKCVSANHAHSANRFPNDSSFMKRELYSPVTSTIKGHVSHPLIPHFSRSELLWMRLIR